MERVATKYAIIRSAIQLRNMACLLACVHARACTTVPARAARQEFALAKKSTARTVTYRYASQVVPRWYGTVPPYLLVGAAWASA